MAQPRNSRAARRREVENFAREFPNIAGLVRFLFTMAYAVLWSSFAVMVAALLGAPEFYTGYACGAVALLVLHIREDS